MNKKYEENRKNVKTGRCSLYVTATITYVILMSVCVLSEVLKDYERPIISIDPSASLFEAIKLLLVHKVHRLPVVDQVTGNALYILTHKRILRFLYLFVSSKTSPHHLAYIRGSHATK